MAVFACADLHGCRWAWNKIRDILKGEDVLFVIGDCADRGPDGWIIINEVLNRPNTIYIKGNHEDMLVGAFSRDFEKKYYGFNLWMSNGGETTYDKMIADPNYKNIIQKLKKLPLEVEYKNTNGQNIIMCHSGDIRTTNEKKLWNRSHYFSKYIDTDCIIIHGHTPIPYIMEDLMDEAKYTKGAYWYANGYKCDIDCGTVFTDTCVLLNLDTFEEIIFNKEDN